MLKSILPFVLLTLALNCFADKPVLMLPTKYYAGIDVPQYWISEKLDGVRARWDGQKLISRGGHVFAAPTWFTKGFPTVALDGELWLARQRYADTWSIVSQKTAHEGWRKIRFMLFDLPESTGHFNQRLSELKALMVQNHNPYLAIIPQFRLSDTAALMAKLDSLVAAGSEGLILHRGQAMYQSGRSNDILKLKPTLYGKATVIGYRAGKGKFTGMVGSLHVRTDAGLRFYVGSGLSTAERKHPPPLNSLIRFKYHGHTKTGLPRFPVFLEQLSGDNPIPHK